MKSKSDSTRTNRDIKAPKIRLIDSNGDQAGIVSNREALEKAAAVSLDLVEISPNAEPPVCRIMDYGKFVFEKNKQKAVAKKKQKQVQVKEIKLRPGTEEADYQVKLRKLTQFLENGDKTKISIRFRGREMTHQQLGMDVMKRLEKDLLDIGVVEQRPKLEGRQMIMILSSDNAK